MTWRLVLDEQAEDEILKAAEWYQHQSLRLRHSFLDAVAVSLAAIETNPLQYQAVSGIVRRAMIPRFPYALLYSVDKSIVVVTVCVHMHRDPKTWQSRFPE